MDGSARSPGGDERHSKHSATPFVTLDRSRCEACWECVAVCPGSVLGKIDMRFHRHAVVRNADRCRGCRKCVDVCATGALSSRGRRDATATPASGCDAGGRP